MWVLVCIHYYIKYTFTDNIHLLPHIYTSIYTVEQVESDTGTTRLLIWAPGLSWATCCCRLTGHTMGTGPGATPSHCAPRWMGATVLTFFRRKYAGLNFKGSYPACFHVNKLKRLNGGIIAVGDKRDFPRFSVLISIVCVQIYWCEDF